MYDYMIDIVSKYPTYTDHNQLICSKTYKVFEYNCLFTSLNMKYITKLNIKRGQLKIIFFNKFILF